MIRGRILPLVVAMALLAPGCAYFNTLYYARQNFRQAEAERERAPDGPVPESVRDLYLKAAKKCAKVITEHPRSRWVDDAILLMGRCFYQREEYEKAATKFEDLLRLYPGSNLAREAAFMRGMALFGLQRYGEARDVFTARKDGAKEDDERFRAWLMIGRTEHALGHHDEAAATLRELLAWRGSGDARAEALFWLGEALSAAGKPDEALAALREAAARADREAFRRKVNLRIGEVLVDRGESLEAARFFAELAARTADPTEEAKLQLRVAEAERRAGRVEAALATLEAIIEDHPKSEQAAEAQYRIGLIHEVELRQYEKALALFDGVREISPGAEATRNAGEERQKILELQRLQGNLAALDSTRTEERAQAYFDIAEALLLRLDDAEGALEAYRACRASDPSGPSAPRALLAAAWVLDHPLGRPEEATALLSELAAHYPGTTQAERARGLLADRGAPLPEPAPIPLRVPGEVSPSSPADSTLTPADSALAPGTVPPGG